MYILTETKVVDKWHDVLLVTFTPHGDKIIHTSVAQPEAKKQLKDSRLIQNRGTEMVQSRTGQTFFTFNARYCHEQMHLNTKALRLAVGRM